MARPVQPQLDAVLIPRDEFLDDYWDYESGEHVTFLGPTQSGKTTLADQLLGKSVSEDLPAIVLVMKPRDRTVDRMIKHHDWKKVETWPPVKFPGQKKRTGWVLWPKHSYDPDRDDPKLHTQFRKAILDAYKKGNRVVFGDEIYGLTAELGLKDELIALYSRGSSMGTGLWAASQKPTHIPHWAFSQPKHIFLAKDPDKRARERFGEIGGIDPKYVEEQVNKLPEYHWFYICRSGGESTSCIVGP